MKLLFILACSLICFGISPLSVLPTHAQSGMDEEAEYRELQSYFLVCEDENENCSYEFFNDCTLRHGDTTRAMSFCEGILLRYWDDQLNWQYHRVMSAASRQHPELEASLRDAQRKWIAFRDARCGIYDFFDGSVWGPTKILCNTVLTRDSVMELRTVEYASGLDIPAVLNWSAENRVFMDLNCDGHEDVVWPGLQDHAFGRTVTIGLSDSPRHEPEYVEYRLMIDSNMQHAVCEGPVELEAIFDKTGECPMLRVVDNACDSVFLQWNREYGGYDFFRN